MNFLFNLSGANAPLIKEYDIAPETKVEAGEVVGIENSLVNKASQCDGMLGVCAETHTGKHDELNSRADGNKVRVIIAPDAVYSAKAPVYTAESGTETTVTVPSAGLGISVNGGYAVLVSKAANSANADIVGTKRRISACSVTGDTAVVTVENGGIASKGDVYMLIPDIGGKLSLDTDGKSICFYNSASAVDFICVCTDTDAGTVGVKLKTTVLA